MQEKRTSLTVLIQQYGIPYFRDSKPTRIGAAEAEALQKARIRLEELEEEKMDLEAQIKVIVGMDITSLVTTAPAFDLPVESIQELFIEHQSFELEIGALKASGDHEENDLAVLQAKAAGFKQKPLASSKSRWCHEEPQS